MRNSVNSQKKPQKYIICNHTAYRQTETDTLKPSEMISGMTSPKLWR